MAKSEEEIALEWYERKSVLMQATLGKEHDEVMHSIIPYAVGGMLDLYYYPHGVAGTAVATKELSELTDQVSKNDVYDCFELVMFTRRRLELDVVRDETTEFGRIHASIGAILNYIAWYSTQASLNPNDTLEFPLDMETVGGRCLIFDDLGSHADDVAGTFGLLAIIEVYRSEMEYAREHGAAKLFQQLEAKGYYPYSDMDRDPMR